LWMGLNGFRLPSTQPYILGPVSYATSGPCMTTKHR
jgi:hypothetical protein